MRPAGDEITTPPMRHCLPLLIALGACQEPFGTDRRFLEGNRIAAVRTERTEAGLRAHIALVVDGRLYASEPPEIRWFWTTATTASGLVAVSTQETPVATGPAPLLEADAGRLLVDVGFPDGERRQAWIDIDAQAEAPILEDVEVFGIPLDPATVEEDDLERTHRESLPLEPIGVIPNGSFARFTARYQTERPEVTTRWMLTAPHGTLLELNRTSTDWAAARLVLDGLAVEEREPIEPGVVSLLALAIDQSGRNAWRVEDLWVDAPTTNGVQTTSGRWLAAPSSLPSGLVRATLAAQADAPTGLTITEAVAVSPDELPDDDPYGVESYCLHATGPFDPTWLLEMRCSPATLDGATVVLELQ